MSLPPFCIPSSSRSYAALTSMKRFAACDKTQLRCQLREARGGEGRGGEREGRGRGRRGEGLDGVGDLLVIGVLVGVILER